MEYYACPACGSEYFLSSKKPSRTVFKFGGDQELEIFDKKLNEKINHSKVFCGACSWHGSLSMLAAPIELMGLSG